MNRGKGNSILPIIKLTKSKNGKTGTATFVFISPNSIIGYTNYTNKVLLPEIILNFTLNDGKSYSFLIEYKVFQELRRLLTLHLKKIMENENILLLKIISVKFL